MKILKVDRRALSLTQGDGHNNEIGGIGLIFL